MNTQKNSPRKQKKHPSKIDGRYLLKAFGVCLITFIMGIFIGKKLTPQDRVQDLKKQIKQSEHQDHFTFFTTLPNQESVKTSPQKPQISPSSNKISSTKIPPSPSKNHASTSYHTSVPQSNSLDPSFAPDGKKYTIQVGAFQTKREAEGLIKILRKSGYSAYVTKADLAKKGIWYRVRVGGFSSHAEAKKSLQTLQMETGLKSFVTKIN